MVNWCRSISIISFWSSELLIATGEMIPFTTWYCSSLTLISVWAQAERCLKIKMLSYQYRNSHYKDKTTSRLSYLYEGNSYTRKDGLHIETAPEFVASCLEIVTCVTTLSIQIGGYVNSLAPEKFEWNLIHVIVKQIFMIDGWGICHEIALIWMSLAFTDDQSTLVQVMAWCHQATSHYLSQCWPRSLSPSGITRPQWVKRHGTLLQH